MLTFASCISPKQPEKAEIFPQMLLMTLLHGQRNPGKVEPLLTAHNLHLTIVRTIVPIIVWLGFDPFRPVQNPFEPLGENSLHPPGPRQWMSLSHVRALFSDTICFGQSRRTTPYSTPRHVPLLNVLFHPVVGFGRPYLIVVVHDTNVEIGCVLGVDCGGSCRGQGYLFDRFVGRGMY